MDLAPESFFKSPNGKRCLLGELINLGAYKRAVSQRKHAQKEAAGDGLIESLRLKAGENSPQRKAAVVK